MRYNWQQKDWPHFTFSLTTIEKMLSSFEEKTIEIDGFISAVPKDVEFDAMFEMMAFEAIKNSAIEGEVFSYQDMISSIKQKLGFTHYLNADVNKRAEGMGELMAHIRNNYKEPLTIDRLLEWHRMLFNGESNFLVGEFRKHQEPMQVISGVFGKEKIHYAAPPSTCVPNQMNQYITWFNNTSPRGRDDMGSSALRAAIAHLYFESIHPFEDGNGRIGRVIIEKALSQGMCRPALIGISRIIEMNKAEYYFNLEKAQQSNEITSWIFFFVKTLIIAQDQAYAHLQFFEKKISLLNSLKMLINERQLTAIKRMLEEGPKGFEGGMNARKYIGITKASKATATRDLQDLLEKGIFKVYGAGRNTSYQVNI